MQQAPLGRPRLAPVVFQTEELPPRQRLDGWNAAFGSLNEIALSGEPDAAGATRSVNWMLGSMVLSMNQVPDSSFLRDAARVRRDGLDHWVIRVLRKGQSLLRHPGFTASVGPGQPVLFSMDETWASVWRGAEWVSLTIPRDPHPQISAGLAALPRGPLQGAGASLLARTLFALHDQLSTAADSDLPMLTEAARSMVAACLLTGVTPPVDADQSRKERVRRAIRAGIGSARLTPNRLAELTGLSRSTLYRMFEGEGGVARCIQDTRLAFVHAALRDPAQAGRSVAEIAAAHGFPDPSVFARTFRRAYGTTPSTLRQAPPGLAPTGPRRRELQGRHDLATRLYHSAA
jgi:AraC-like DNA-binding protein